jgi:hypothetical protein
MTNDFADRPDIHRDERDACGSSLNENDRNRFVIAREHQSVECWQHL